MSGASRSLATGKALTTYGMQSRFYGLHLYVLRDIFCYKGRASYINAAYGSMLLSPTLGQEAPVVHRPRL